MGKVHAQPCTTALCSSLCALQTSASVVRLAVTKAPSRVLGPSRFDDVHRYGHFMPHVTCSVCGGVCRRLG